MRPSTFCAAGLAALLVSLSGASLRADPTPPTPPAFVLTLDALMARFRSIPGLTARFREEKHIALLARPIVNEGTLHYAPPGRLARHTLTPSISSVLLDGGTLRFSDGVKEETLDLAANPLIGAFVDGFRQLLAGDRASLERAFTLDLKGAGDHWEIVLRPRSEQLSHVIREMAFTGDGAVVARMRVLEASGDEAVTTFSGVDAKHVYAPAEAQQVFRLARK